MTIERFKSNTGLMILIYALLTLRSLFNRVIVRKNLNTGDRKSTTNNFLGYMEFCNQHIVTKIVTTSSAQQALEVGPGDNHSLALMIAAMGYQNVDTIDKYQVNYDDSSNFMLYEKISSHFQLDDWKALIKRVNRFDAKVDLSQLVSKKQNYYDLIYSVSVVEHLWPWRSQMKLLTELLNNGGQMIHIINFTDHGMFSPIGNRFTFRKIPSFIYNLIMSPVGRPNRILPNDLIRFFENSNYQVGYKVIRTHTRVLLDKENYSINSIPQTELSELLTEYNLDLEQDLDKILDLCIGSAVFTIRKNA